MRALNILTLLLFEIIVFSQENKLNTIILNPATGIKNQETTEACYAYATCSFLESELLRKEKGEYDLSEAFYVYHIFLDKGYNYFLRQSKANFSIGGLAHDVIRILNTKGAILQEFYPGVYLIDSVNNYSVMCDTLKSFLNTSLKQRPVDQNWPQVYEDIIKSYLGKIPDTFNFEGYSYSPRSLAKYFSLNPDDYISITSFTHHPFYSRFILEIPDNFSNGEFYNIPINKLIEIIDTALTNGYTFVWDGDASEPGITYDIGFIMLPERNEKEKLVFI